MASSGGGKTAFAVLAGLMGMGYVVAKLGAVHPVGHKVVESKEELRRQGAQGHATKAGLDPKKAEHVYVQTKGGDAGYKYK